MNCTIVIEWLWQPYAHTEAVLHTILPPYHWAHNDISYENVSRRPPISNSILIPATFDCNSIVTNAYVTVLYQYIIAWICRITRCSLKFIYSVFTVGGGGVFHIKAATFLCTYDAAQTCYITWCWEFFWKQNKTALIFSSISVAFVTSYILIFFFFIRT